MKADKIIINGRVRTMENLTPYARAVAIRGDLVVAVGNNDEIKKLAASYTHNRRRDCRYTNRLNYLLSMRRILALKKA